MKPLFELGKMFSINTILFYIWNGKENMILFITSIIIQKNLTESFVLSLHPSRWMNTSVLGLRHVVQVLSAQVFPVFVFKATCLVFLQAELMKPTSHFTHLHIHHLLVLILGN
jgi:hypothetical protein